MKSRHARPKVSFVILTMNSMQHLPECMMSIESQPVTKEIVVLDGGSTDGTVEYAEQHTKIVASHKDNLGNLARARNTGIMSASGKYIIFVDSDVVLPRGWATGMIEMFERYFKRVDNIASISCEYISVPRNWITESLDKARKLQFKGDLFLGSGYLQSSVWRTDFLKKIKADERYAKGGEDLDIFQKAVGKGYSHFVTTQFNVKHYGPSTLWGLLKKYYRYGKTHWRIPSQKSAWNSFKLFYWPFTLLSLLLSPAIGSLPFWLIFLSPYIAYTLILLDREGEVQPVFTFVNGLKLQAHSLGMATGAMKGVLS